MNRALWISGQFRGIFPNTFDSLGYVKLLNMNEIIEVARAMTDASFDNLPAPIDA
jgi:hypothetical protein